MPLVMLCSPLPLSLPKLEISEDEILSLQAQKSALEENGRHWAEELAGSAADARLAHEKAERLEREGRREREELRARLESVQLPGRRGAEEVHV